MITVARIFGLVDNPSQIMGGGYMKGSIHQDKRNERYYIKLFLNNKQVTIHTDKRTNAPILSKVHAYKVLAMIQAEIDEGVFDRETWKKKKDYEFKYLQKDQTLRVYAKHWLKKREEVCEAGGIVKRTLKDDRTAVVNYIVKKLGRKKLKDIDKQIIDIFYNSLPLSASGKYNTTSTFRKILNDAKEEGVINKIPEFPKMSKKSNERKKFMPPEIQDKVFEHIPSKDIAIFLFMRQWGLRPGEARAIKKSSVRDGELHIEWSFSENILRNTTKTGEVRSYLITPFIQSVLDGIADSDSEFLFVRDNGKPYTSKNLNKIWRQACKDAGIPHFKLYNAMRHSLARNLLENGFGFDMVAEVLGHSSVEMTRSFYADMPQNKVQDALSSLSKSWNPGR